MSALIIALVIFEDLSNELYFKYMVIEIKIEHGQKNSMSLIGCSGVANCCITNIYLSLFNDAHCKIEIFLFLMG